MNTFNFQTNVERWRNELSKLNENTDFLDNEQLNVFQKCAMYRSLRHGFKLNGINDPSMTEEEMDEIVSLQIIESNNFIKRHDINPRTFDFAQIRELIDAEANGLNISHYKNPTFSADHMYICKELQSMNINAFTKITSDMHIEDAINLRNTLIKTCPDSRIQRIMNHQVENCFSHS